MKKHELENFVSEPFFKKGLVHFTTYEYSSVLRIRDVYPGSDLFPSRIPDPHPRFKYFNPKTWFPTQSTYIYRASQWMSPRRNWDSPTPLAASECPLPPGLKGGGAHSPAAKGVGESQFRRLEKKLSTLPTLWFPSSRKYDQVVHPGSRSWLSTHPGSRGQKGTGSRFRNTGIRVRTYFVRSMEIIIIQPELEFENLEGAHESIPSIVGQYGNTTCRTGPPSHVGWLNRFIVIDSWAA